MQGECKRVLLVAYMSAYLVISVCVCVCVCVRSLYTKCFYVFNMLYEWHHQGNHKLFNLKINSYCAFTPKAHKEESTLSTPPKSLLSPCPPSECSFLLFYFLFKGPARHAC